jgi:hypothetical protein
MDGRVILWIIGAALILSFYAYCMYESDWGEIPPGVVVVLRWVLPFVFLVMIYFGSKFYDEYKLMDILVTLIIVSASIALTASIMRFFKEKANRGEIVLLNDELQAKADAEKTGEPVDEFHNEELDNLITQGKFEQARKRLFDIIKVAAEINDNESIKKYKKYQRIIDEALDGYD